MLSSIFMYFIVSIQNIQVSIQNIQETHKFIIRIWELTFSLISWCKLYGSEKYLFQKKKNTL